MESNNGTLGKYSKIMREAAAAWMKRMNEFTADFDPSALQPKSKEADVSGIGQLRRESE